MMVAALFVAVMAQAKPQIAIFPVIDKTGERDPEFAQKLISESRTYLGGRFTLGGYELLDSKKVDEGLVAAKFDGSDRDQWVTANLVAMGQKIGTPNVAFAVITESTSMANGAYFNIGGGATGVAKVRLWLIDVPAGKATIKGVTFEGKSSTNALGDLSGSKARIIRAVQIAFDLALNDLLKIKAKK